MCLNAEKNEQCIFFWVCVITVTRDSHEMYHCMYAAAAATLTDEQSEKLKTEADNFAIETRLVVFRTN